jgi:hypothetical protein
MNTSTRISMGVGRFIVAITTLLALGGCTSIVRRVFVQRVPLNFVGQISFGAPLVRKSRVVVPLTFSGGEWGRHSLISTYRVESHVSERTIEMTVLISLARDKPVPRELRLGRIAPGQYSVAYRDPDGTRRPLGQIVIPTTR